MALEGTKEKPQPCASSNLDENIGKPATVTSFIPSALVEAEEEAEAEMAVAAVAIAIEIEIAAKEKARVPMEIPGNAHLATSTIMASVTAA